MQKIELEEYARILCLAKSEYSYPCVTCFDFDAFLQGASPVAYRRKHGNMLEVEELIKRQLVSHDLEEVKDGLSNVLFWGFATFPLVWRKNVREFRRDVSYEQLKDLSVLIARLESFDHREMTVKGVGNVGHYFMLLHYIPSLNMPKFSQMSFTSKLLMFLSPSTNPVLDSRIAEFAIDMGIPPVSNIKIQNKTMKLNKFNRRIYGEWSSWCIDVARQVNELPSSPCRDLRAVDVERAVFYCIDADRDAAVKLLLGPTPK